MIKNGVFTEKLKIKRKTYLYKNENTKFLRIALQQYHNSGTLHNSENNKMYKREEVTHKLDSLAFIFDFVEIFSFAFECIQLNSVNFLKNF